MEKVKLMVKVILIPVQEATFASGGKNKAVRKLKMFKRRFGF